MSCGCSRRKMMTLLVLMNFFNKPASSFDHIIVNDNNNNNNNNNNNENLLLLEKDDVLATVAHPEIYHHHHQLQQQQPQQQRGLQTDDDDLFVCNICGNNNEYEVQNWDGMINWANFLDHDGDNSRGDVSYEILVSCEQLHTISQNGGITPNLCTEVVLQTITVCDCQHTTTTTSPTSTSTSTSTSSSTGNDYYYYCYNNLTEIAIDEDAVNTTNIKQRREIILCPNTVFEMGHFYYLNGDETDYYIDDGFFAPIQPKPNSHYKCGYDGSSYQNCIIRGGDFAIFLSIDNQDESDDDDDDMTTGIIIFEGIIFESNKKSSVVLNKRGDYTFIDCIFRNQQNFGTIIIPFGNDNFNDEIPAIATLLRHQHHNRYLEYHSIPTQQQQQKTGSNNDDEERKYNNPDDNNLAISNTKTYLMKEQQQKRKLQRTNNDDDDIFVCSVCIGNAPVTNPDVVIGETRCDVIQNLGLTGYLPQDTCRSISITVNLLCGCDDPPTSQPSPFPSSTPTSHPSFNPTQMPSISTMPSILPSFSTSPTVDTSTLKITFRQTVFEGNRIMGTNTTDTSSSEFVRPGIISAESERVVLIFEDVKFHNNQFGDPTIQERTWAVKTSGPLTMTNTCFEDNEFLGIGTVLTIGYPAVNVSNNFGTYMDGVDRNCQFLVKVPDDDDGSYGNGIITLRNNENATYWCIPFDSTECQAQDPPTNAPSLVPSDSPSSSPVNPPSYWISDDDNDDDVVGDTLWRETAFSGASSCHFDVLLRIIPTMMMVAMVGTTWAAFLSIK